MSKYKIDLHAQQASKVDMDVLTELVESQLGNVVGGGYSQYAVHHAKDSNQIDNL